MRKTLTSSVILLLLPQQATKAITTTSNQLKTNTMDTKCPACHRQYASTYNLNKHWRSQVGQICREQIARGSRQVGDPPPSPPVHEIAFTMEPMETPIGMVQ